MNDDDDHSCGHDVIIIINCKCGDAHNNEAAVMKEKFFTRMTLQCTSNHFE